MLLLLILLYVSEGIPYGFQTKFLPLLIRKYGGSLKVVGFSTLLSLPWICKFPFAPFYDRYPKLRRKWMKFCLLSLGTTFFLSSYLMDRVSSVPASLTFHLLSICLIASSFTALMDISVDGFATKSLPQAQVGMASVAQANGFKIGILIGGAVLIWLHQYITLQALFLSMGCYYLFILGVVTFCYNSQIASQVQLSRKISKNDIAGDTKLPSFWESIIDMFNTPGTSDMLVFIAFYKVGEMIFFAMLPIYLLETKKYSNNLLALSSTSSLICSMLGTAAGGFLVKPSSSKRTLLPFIILCRSLISVSQTINIINNCNSGILITLAIDSFYKFFSGAVTAVIFSEMMLLRKNIPSHIRSSHYSILTTVEVLGKLISSSFSGTLVELFGFQNVFLLCCLLEVSVWILLKSKVCMIGKIKVN